MGSRIGFCADIHIGNHKVFGGTTHKGMNNRCLLAIRALNQALQAAEKAGCTDFVILGDLFDTTKPTPQMLAEVQDCLRTDMDVHILLGNHDAQSPERGDHALGPLHGWGKCRVYEESTGLELPGVELIMVPFKPGPASLWCPGEIGSLMDQMSASTDPMILCLHLGLRSGHEEKFLLDADDAICTKTLAGVCKEYGIDTVIAGNWHFKKKWTERGVLMYQVGTLAPTGFDNPGLTGHGNMAMYDAGTQRWSSVAIPGPRFVKAATFDGGLNALRNISKMQKDGDAVYLRWQVGREQVADAREAAADAQVHCEISIDKAEIKAAARSASAAAKSSDNLAEAVQKYVERMDLTEGVERAGVLRRCRTYLK